MPRCEHFERCVKRFEHGPKTFDDMVVGVLDVKGGHAKGSFSILANREMYSTDNTGNVGPDKLQGPIYIVDDGTSNSSAAEDPTGREDGGYRSRSSVPRCELFVMAMIPPTQLPKPYLSEAFRLYEERNSGYLTCSNEEMLSLLKSQFAYSSCIVKWDAMQPEMRRAQGSDCIIEKYPLEHREGLEHMGDGDIQGGCTVSQG